nr:hypothetical protein [Bacteroidota bacterium]
MKQNNLAIVLVLFLLPIISSSQSNIYNIRYQTIINSGTSPPAYGTAVDFQTNQITSDFGRRRGNLSKWHRGVDFSVGNIVGDHILSLNGGIVRDIDGTGYKYIITEGTQQGEVHHFGYGHLFEDEPTAQRTMEIGDMVLIELPSPNSGEYAIINLNQPECTAIGSINNASLTYNNIQYTVSNVVNTDDPIGIIGNSGGNYSYQHVHLYLFENVTTAILDHNRIHNDKDPLEFVNHVCTNYTLTIHSDDLTINGN